MSADGGTKAVVAALAANLGIAVSKFVAFAFTGSSSMLAEAIHSVADSGNQLLLLRGGRRATREASAAHPFGYGRERYVYAFIVSVVLFSVGGLFALYEGWHKIDEARGGHAGGVDSPAWAIGVLSVAIVLEGFSFRTAIRESNRRRGAHGWVAFIRRAKAPELPVILLEDLAALLGLTFALLGIIAATLTSNILWDGVGTLAIGALLVTVAIALAVETKSLLLGEGADAEAVATIRTALEAGDVIESVIHLRTLHLGPDELLIVAKIAVRPGDSAGMIARAIDEAEERIRAVEPAARVIYLEPDIFSETAAAAGDDPASTPGGRGGR